MASGVKVADGVKDIYNAMKVVKTDADQTERMRLVVLHISGTSIDVEKIFREKDLEDVDDVYKFFLGLLDVKHCRYILYDCHFETKESSKKEELVFFMWAPDTAPIKEKMNYASSKEAIRKVLTGIKHELQVNELSDCSDRDAFAEKLGKGVIKVEGHPVRS
ncbi:non-muscle cofilin 1-like [Siniperca chuatsi]|uniref:non-muscle cofilin 1-like n=1 Tax=Siniperca chuatsi TaxID=119488 RepID=UPI001CE0CA3A|nr:non-muscle cofilin 1-like [Siniperca chuatsi]